VVRDRARAGLAAADDDLGRDLEDAVQDEVLPDAVPRPVAPAEAVQEPVPSDSGSPPPRPADIEILTSVALDRFLQDDHRGARRAATMALELDPRNRKAQEILKILGALR
jgi:hypothetical protein